MNTSVSAPLRAPDYRRLWVGQVVSVVGDKINQIAMAIMVYALTGSMLQMGIMLGVTALPAALFGVVAGVYVDRWDRRRTMVSADLIRAAAVLAIPFRSVSASSGRTCSRSSHPRSRCSSCQPSAR